MLSPRPGPGVCRICFNFTNDYSECYACAHNETWADAVAPISYSVAGGRLHHALAAYKRNGGEIADRLTLDLAAVLWRHLVTHERCVALAAGVERFEFVTAVPSGDRVRDAHHPLRTIVGDLVEPTRTRHQRVLGRAATKVPSRTFDPAKFHAHRRLHGESVLLIDDTWTTGASVQSAAAALKAAGAGRVAAVVIGRHLNRAWHHNERRLRAIAQPFDWSRCVLCTERSTAPRSVGGI
jgi:hypothetical protein